MDWLRRNWVDALLVALIVAGVGGLLTVLLRGGFNSNTTPIQAPPPAAVTTPSNTSPSSTVTPPQATPSPATPPAPSGNPATGSSKPLEVPVIPSSGAEPQPPTPSPKPSSAPRVVTNQNPPATPQTITRAQPAQASSEPGNYSRADFLRNYRIAVGTYSSASRAGASASRLRRLGFPAQAFSSGNAFIVVVGPYAREASARAAFAKLRQGNPDAVLYFPNGARERAKPSVAAAPVAPRASPGGPGGAPMKLDQGVAYLQVGAFKDTKSALPLLERLKGAGFKALLRAAADGFTRVLVGPYDTNALQSAKASLSDQGLSPFPVKQ